MKRKSLLFILFPLFLSFADFFKKPGQPNIILIFMDDMGYGDLSCYGALNYKTEQIDQLAMEGMRFTNFLSAQAVCSASRAALLTGCYPNRIGITGALMPYSKIGINDAEQTIAELVKTKGYSTGIIGKWHLGHQKKFLPLQHGFDEYFGIPYSNDMWPVNYDGTPATSGNKLNFPPLPLVEGNEKIETLSTLEAQGLLTKRYTERAIKFINQHKKQPFFLYLPHSMPHVPIEASPAFKGKSKAGLYGDVMMEIDWSVGQILQTLKALKLEKNTLVIFTSDNGPWLNYGDHAGSTGGLREGKGTSFEGGQRVPCIMRWPGKISPGVVTNHLASTIDLYSTIATITQSVPTSDHKIDGLDLSPIIFNKNASTSPRKEFYYYYRQNNLEAVRLDHWKLVLAHPGRSYLHQKPGTDGFPGPAPENVPFYQALYDLRRDPGEQYDVKDQFPDVMAQLNDLANKARADLGDDLLGIKGSGVRRAGTE